ncbi:MAG: peptidoglycan DD-metalloendopeptidase family protein, partial [Anaerolineae bacterium]|nr:peptidoglycan DD-metalloendopeptidase family protein [Anaerolineae bacterium]
MSKRNIGRTVGIHALFWGVIVIIQLQLITYNSALAQTTPTPAPFLGPIYYNRQNIYNIIDHNKPLASTGDDGNDIILHYNGVSYAATPMPDNGYGYDEHGGIDYSLKYVPVLAAANGTVIAAGWEDPSNHRGSYGLRIRIDHGQYDTIYGHLSVLTVATGDPVEADPEDRNSIIGISGNTGAVFGGCGDVGDDPTCGAHLHFEVRDTGGYRPVNPYGWIGLTPMPSATPVIDPWATDPAGATSYDLWQNEPAIFSSSHQYPGGTPVIEPAVNNARMIIDDGSADFSIEQGDCWLPDTGNESYNFGYHVAFSNDTDTCIVRWNIKRDAFTPPGDYDIFVHIPQDVAPSLGARYTIHHNQAVSVAIVVQAAYVGNEEHNAWAYLGRYDFAMNDIIAEYITLNDNTLDDDDDHFVLADAIMLAPANAAMPLPQRYLYVSFASSGYAGNVPYENEDILLFDAATGEWHMFFDGSDVGLAAVGIDAFDFRNGHLFFSLDAP